MISALLMAVVVFVGTSSQTLAALLCNIESCPKQAAKSVEHQAPESCCPSLTVDNESNQSSDRDEQDTCCCSFKAAPAATVETVKLSVPLPLLMHLAGPESQPTTVVGAVPAESDGLILFESDLSPPRPQIERDRGRAPPAA